MTIGLAAEVAATLADLPSEPQAVEAIRQAGATYFPQRNPPTGMIVGVQSLPLDGLLKAGCGRQSREALRQAP